MLLEFSFLVFLLFYLSIKKYPIFICFSFSLRFSHFPSFCSFLSCYCCCVMSYWTVEMELNGVFRIPYLSAECVLSDELPDLFRLRRTTLSYYFFSNLQEGIHNSWRASAFTLQIQKPSWGFDVNFHWATAKRGLKVSHLVSHKPSGLLWIEGKSVKRR